MQTIQIVLITSVLAVFVAYYLFSDLPDPEYTTVGEFAKDYDLETIHTSAPKFSYDVIKEKYAFGRYRTPIQLLNMHQLTFPQRIAQLKEFAYTAISDDEWFIGSALLQFNYNSAAIVYVYNTKTNHSYVTQLELPIVASFGPTFDANSSAINKCVKWRKGMLGLTAMKCYNRVSHSYDVQLSGHFQRVEGAAVGNAKKSVPFQIEYSISLQGQAMSMIYPLGPNRPSMVTKYAGAVSSGRLVLDQKEYILSEALGMMDWTRGLLRRLTYWHWTCLSFTDTTNNRLIGLQLSEGTYDNAQNVSLESTLWINTKAYHINSRIIYTPVNPQAKAYETDWTVRSEDGSIDLIFRFGNVIKGSFHYGILDGDLFHMWGLYSGSVRPPVSSESQTEIRLVNVPGILEDHYALW